MKRLTIFCVLRFPGGGLRPVGRLFHQQEERWAFPVRAAARPPSGGVPTADWQRRRRQGRQLAQVRVQSVPWCYERSSGAPSVPLVF